MPSTEINQSSANSIWQGCFKTCHSWCLQPITGTRSSSDSHQRSFSPWPMGPWLSLMRVVDGRLMPIKSHIPTISCHIWMLNVGRTTSIELGEILKGMFYTTGIWKQTFLPDLWKPHNTIFYVKGGSCSSQWQIQDFPGGGSINPQGGGANLLLGQNFLENCMKMKEIGPRRRGTRLWRPPPRSPNGTNLTRCSGSGQSAVLYERNEIKNQSSSVFLRLCQLVCLR